MMAQEKYIDLLIEIARTQKQIISQFIDMQAQIAYKIPTKPSGLFKKRLPEYEKRKSKNSNQVDIFVFNLIRNDSITIII